MILFFTEKTVLLHVIYTQTKVAYNDGTEKKTHYVLFFAFKL